MKQRDHLKVVERDYVPSGELKQIIPEVDARLFAEIVDHYTVKRRGGQRHQIASIEDDLAQVNSMLLFTGKSPWCWTREDFEAWCDNKATIKRNAVSTQRKYQGAIKKFMLIIIAGAIGYFWFTVLPDIREHGLFHQIGQRK